MKSCECGCGEVVRRRFVPGHNIRIRSTHPAVTHHLSATSEYKAIRAAIRRCHNPSHQQYANYGGRGIQVCERWRDSVQAFIEDVGFKPTVSHTLERIDNDGNYEPGNVKWASYVEQARNRRMPNPASYPRR